MLSVPHLIVIFLVALVVLGPEKLPQVARVLGKTMADFRRITNDFRVQIEDEMRELERQTQIRQEIATAQAAMNQPAQLPPIEPVPNVVATTIAKPHVVSEQSPEPVPAAVPASAEHADAHSDVTAAHNPSSDSGEVPVDGQSHSA